MTELNMSLIACLYVAPSAVEKRVLLAAAEAQQTLGCPVIIHPAKAVEAPFEIVRILQEAGGDIGKTVMSHLDSES